MAIQFGNEQCLQQGCVMCIEQNARFKWTIVVNSFYEKRKIAWLFIVGGNSFFIVGGNKLGGNTPNGILQKHWRSTQTN